RRTVQRPARRGTLRPSDPVAQAVAVHGLDDLVALGMLQTHHAEQFAAVVAVVAMATGKRVPLGEFFSEQTTHGIACGFLNIGHGVHRAPPIRSRTAARKSRPRKRMWKPTMSPPPQDEKQRQPPRSPVTHTLKLLL